MSTADTKQAVAVVQGIRVSVLTRSFRDTHFISLTTGSKHGSVVAASVMPAALASAAEDDEVAKGGAVELGVMAGKPLGALETVLVRRLAVALADIGDFRPLFLMLNVPAPPSQAEAVDRRNYVLGITAAVLDVMAGGA